MDKDILEAILGEIKRCAEGIEAGAVNAATKSAYNVLALLVAEADHADDDVYRIGAVGIPAVVASYATLANRAADMVLNFEDGDDIVKLARVFNSINHGKSVGLWSAIENSASQLTPARDAMRRGLPDAMAEAETPTIKVAGEQTYLTSVLRVSLARDAEMDDVRTVFDEFGWGALVKPSVNAQSLASHIKQQRLPDNEISIGGEAPLSAYDIPDEVRRLLDVKYEGVEARTKKSA